MKRIKEFIREYYKQLIFLSIMALIFLMPVPYYVEAPGGLTNLDKKVIINNKNINGSYNLSYVTEYKGSIPMLIYAYFNENFDIYKTSEIRLNNESNEEYIKRDLLYLEQSLSNAVITAYNKANKKIIINDNYLYVGYILENSITDLKVGDIIKKIDKNEVSTLDGVKSIIDSKVVGDKLEVEVINDNKELKRTVTVIKEDNQKLIGIVPIEVLDYKTSPNVKIKMDSNESGGSGGLMLSLSIYDLLVEKDLANGRKIAGTGTIDKDGNVGEIGGIEYKIKGAVKDKADVFFVPKKNYKEALKVKKENKYKLNIVKVETLDEAIKYLSK